MYLFGNKRIHGMIYEAIGCFAAGVIIYKIILFIDEEFSHRSSHSVEAKKKEEQEPSCR